MQHMLLLYMLSVAVGFQKFSVGRWACLFARKVYYIFDVLDQIESIL